MGRPSIIQRADVTILGEAKMMRFSRFTSSYCPKRRILISHPVYEDYKSRLQKAITRSWSILMQSLRFLVFEIKPSTYQGWWKMVLNSGTRYKFGQFNFKHSQIREDYLRNVMPIKTGDKYLINDLSSLTNDYTSSNWFRSVLLEPKVDEKRKVVDINVLLYPHEKCNRCRDWVFV